MYEVIHYRQAYGAKHSSVLYSGKKQDCYIYAKGARAFCELGTIEVRKVEESCREEENENQPT